MDPDTVAGVSAVPAGGPTQADVVALAGFCQQNLTALVYGATPSSYAPGGFDGNVCGAVVTVHVPGQEEPIQSSRVALRPDMPLQSGLFDLVRGAAQALQAGRVAPQALQSASLGLSVFWDSAMQGSVEGPELAGIDTGRRAVMTVSQGRWALAYDPDRPPEELLKQAVDKARFTDPSTAAVFSLEVTSTEPRLLVGNVPRPQAGASARPPAVAGRFYPGTPDEIDRMLDDLLPEKKEPKPWAAAMVPHAGWIYSGRLAADVLSRVKIPEQVIVVCPKHGPAGADWAVAPHESWSLPGRSVPSDPELARRLADAVSGLELDAAAHAREHAIEVQLPILARLAPDARVVGIAVRGGQPATLERFAEELAGVLREMPVRPLLVISTDMNHFANDAETRRLDRMALDCLEALDPTRLYETVVDNQISMCGMVPAVLVLQTLRQLDSLTRCESVGYATSADASGDTNRVVGYAGMLFN